MWCGGGSELVISVGEPRLRCGSLVLVAAGRRGSVVLGRAGCRKDLLTRSQPTDLRRGGWAGSGRASAGGRRREVGVGKACDGGGAQWDKRRVFE